MPRRARIFSDSGFQHVIVRGIGRQILFEEEADYAFYLSRLNRFSRETGVSICAYCLMENHVHMLTYSRGEEVPAMMKKIGVSYSFYFNKKYERSGHLFQDRNLSEPVESNDYFIKLLRYILNNPAEAGICEAEAYRWSSYRDLQAGVDDIIDLTLLKDVLGSEFSFASFMRGKDEGEFLEFERAPRDDAWARRVMQSCLGVKSGTELQKMDRAARDEALGKLKAQGLSIRQIERLCGINRGVIQKVKVAKENRPR